MVTQPLLIAKQMAAHNPFLQSEALTSGQGNDRMTFMETPLNETMNTVLIHTVSRAVATAGRKLSWWSLWKAVF